MRLFAADRPPRSTVAVEVKGQKDPLDLPFGGRRLSAVDQAYRDFRETWQDELATVRLLDPAVSY